MDKQDMASYVASLDWLARAYLDVPDEKMLDDFRTVDFPLSSSVGEKALAMIGSVICDAQGTSLLPLRVDYTTLFDGFDKNDPFPYESVYMSAERLMMQGSRDEVRRCYLENGFDVSICFEGESSSKEPEDHLSYELAFVSHLLREAHDRRAVGDEAAATQKLAIARSFVSEHITSWVPRFCSDVESNAETDFFKSVAVVTREVCGRLDKVLGIV